MIVPQCVCLLLPGADPAKGRALALENSPAGSPEAEAKAVREKASP